METAFERGVKEALQEVQGILLTDEEVIWSDLEKRVIQRTTPRHAGHYDGRQQVEKELVEVTFSVPRKFTKDVVKESTDVCVICGKTYKRKLTLTNLSKQTCGRRECIRVHNREINKSVIQRWNKNKENNQA